MGALSLVVLALVIPVGCDDGGSGDNGELDAYFESHPYVSDPRDGNPTIVTLSPASAVLSTVGEKAVFKYNGGAGGPITWDVSDPSRGTISGTGGDQGVYTVTAIGVNNVIAYDRQGNAATARITSSSSGGDSTPLAVSASATTLALDGDKSVITVTGGIPPYSWTVSAATKGYLDTSVGSSVVYTRAEAGGNAITVTDSSGIRTSVVITQP
jgi:hypothetical protein